MPHLKLCIVLHIHLVSLTADQHAEESVQTPFPLQDSNMYVYMHIIIQHVRISQRQNLRGRRWIYIACMTELYIPFAHHHLS